MNTASAARSFKKVRNGGFLAALLEGSLDPTIAAAGGSGYKSEMKITGLLATRRSLVDRLGHWEDQARWQEFFETYWKLIYSVARKSGLNDAEAQDVVQETVITVAKKIDKLRYNPAIGSFKGWLLNITRWRIADQFRKRVPSQDQIGYSGDDRRTAMIERIADSNVQNLDELWEAEWQQNLLAAAMTRVKKKVAPKHFQIFDCSVRKEWPAQKIGAALGVSVGQVYLARHRVAALLKKEVKALQKELIPSETKRNRGIPPKLP